jgi:hypothetical protein
MLVYQRVSNESKLFSRKSDESVFIYQAQGISRKKRWSDTNSWSWDLIHRFLCPKMSRFWKIQKQSWRIVYEDSPSLGFSCKLRVFIRWLWTTWIISKRCHTATTFGDATSYEGYPSSRVQPLAARPYVRSSKQYLGQQLGWLSVLPWICLRHLP